jgi:AAA domain/DnaB-like helicase N terminal domain
MQSPDEVAALCRICQLPLQAFYFPAHRIVFDIVFEYADSGAPTDFVSIKQALKDGDQLEEIGGLEFLSSLYDVVPNGAAAAAAGHYINVVLEKYRRRRLILLGSEIQERSYDEHEEFNPLLSQWKQEFSEIVHSNNGADDKKPVIEFLKPSQIKAYEPPEGTLLVGDNHIVRGGVFIVAGPPGVGKSRSTIALGEAGATNLDWLGLKVHSHFRTMIVQNENGRYRLKLEFSELNTERLDQYLVVSPPPPYGLRFDKLDFRDSLKARIESFQPAVIWIDPWNAVARDDKQRDYRETFDLVRDVIPSGDDAPAIGIAAHTRKPLPNERASGRTLLNLLSGSHMLASVPRTIWVMQHATDDVGENRVVVTCCKNNDGELGPRSVWVRDNGLWTPVKDFDWEQWDSPDPDAKKQKAISERSMAEVFDGGNKRLKLSEARDALMKLTGKGRSVCYSALDEKGKFAARLDYDRKTKLMSWIP